MDTPKSSDETIVSALRILSVDVQSKDGIANAALFEAAQRFVELVKENEKLKKDLENAREHLSQRMGINT